jgi:hypothetical protein
LPQLMPSCLFSSYLQENNHFSHINIFGERQELIDLTKNSYYIFHFRIMMSASTVFPNCGKPKKPWFNLCYDCNLKENQKPTCEVCGIEVEEGHYLCLKHWQER